MTDEDRQRLSPAGLRSYHGMAERLALSNDEAAAAIGMRTNDYCACLAAAHANQQLSLPEPSLLAISHFMHVYNLLLWIAAPNEPDWIRQPLQALNGTRPIDCITGGLGQLAAFRQWLELNASSVIN